MKVAHLIKATRIGGAERHLLVLLKALRERDIDAHLLLLVEADNLMDNLVAEAKEREIPVQRIVIHSHLDVPVINRIRVRLKQLEPDILHTHLIHADTFGMVAGRLARVPTIISSRHNDDAFRSRMPVRYLSRWQWNNVRGGIAISGSIKRFAIDAEYADPQKMRVIHYGIEHTPAPPETIEEARQSLRDRLDVPPETHLTGMACRLTEQKGIRYALRALPYLTTDYPDLQLLIAGDGPLLAELKGDARQLNIHDRVHFLGWHENVPRFIAGLDVFLMPSLWEGFGLVALEAMAQRVPIVGSDVSAIPEVVRHGETGLLVPPRRPRELAGALHSLLNDRLLRRHMGLMAEDRLETHFTAARMADETIAAYRDWSD
jgi:glycosyltransferase involved in cell wall biosynthesis